LTPEAAQYLDKAAKDLREARQIATLGLAEVTARSAYYAAFHAAEAYIFELTARAAKTHSGVRHEFARLARTEPRLSPEMTTFLAKAYQYKEISDDSMAAESTVSIEHAMVAIDMADDLVSRVRAILVSGR
jgi:uncharacterized protein (UPF0332 family)